MKKFLTILLCIALSISMLAFTACKGGASEHFDGEYQASNETEIQQLANSLSSKPQSAGFAWENGFKVNLTLSGNMGAGDVSVDMQYCVGLFNSELGLTGSVDLSDIDGTVKANIYFIDGYTYYNGSIGVHGGSTITGKYKETSTYANFMRHFGVTTVLMESFADSLPYASGGAETVNYFVENTTDGLKIKIDIPRQTYVQTQGPDTRSTDGVGTYIWTYDADYNLTGIYADMSSTTTTTGPDFSGQTRISATLEILPFDGVIELPSDLDSYVALVH